MILKNGEVIINEKEVIVTHFEFGKFKENESPYLWKGGIDALIWAKGRIDDALAEARLYYKRGHLELKKCKMKEGK